MAVESGRAVVRIVAIATMQMHDLVLEEPPTRLRRD